jgi:hypothetical protein
MIIHLIKVSLTFIQLSLIAYADDLVIISKCYIYDYYVHIQLYLLSFAIYYDILSIYLSFSSFKLFLAKLLVLLISEIELFSTHFLY